jgi:hypothetical protein
MKAKSVTFIATHFLDNLRSFADFILTTSVVSYIKRAFRKPLRPRVQGAARRAS